MNYLSYIPRLLQISTALEPQSLINLLKDAESHQGRTPTFRNGPRVVDLDILFDENKVYNLNQVLDRELTVPHPSIQTREFVLRPLAEYVDPSSYKRVFKAPIQYSSKFSASSSQAARSWSTFQDPRRVCRSTDHKFPCPFLHFHTNDLGTWKTNVYYGNSQYNP